mgnify:CR=1 FL=1
MVSKKTKQEILRAVQNAGNGFNFFLPRKSVFATLLACGVVLSAPVAFAAGEGENSASEGILIAEMGEKTPEKVLPEAETNKDTLNYMELVDTFFTAERIPSSRWNTPANVYVITSQELEANHYQNAFEALVQLPGVFQISYLNIDPIINGNGRTLFLVDGQRAYSVPPIKMLDRIEVVKGGGSALYGTDAVGGVINFITKKGEKNETVVDIGIGSWKTRDYELFNQGSVGKFGWVIDGKLRKNDAYHFSGSEAAHAIDLTSDKNDNSVNIKLDNKFDDSSSLSFKFDHLSHKYNKKGYSTTRDYYVFNTPTPTYSDLSELYAYSFSNLRTYGRFIDIKNEVSLTYNFKESTSTPGFLRYFNNYSSTDRFDSATSGSVPYNERTQGIDYQNGWEFGKHKIIAGFEWHRLSSESWYWSYNKKKITNTAGYLQDTINVDEKWTLIPGVRFDHSSAYGNRWSPKVAANYRADEKTKVYASWGNVYRAPSFTELYTSHYHRFFVDDAYYYDTVQVGNTGLSPETGHTETIGFEHEFDESTRLSFAAYNAKIKNFIDLDDSLTNVMANINGSTYTLPYYYKLTRESNFSGGEKTRGFEINFNKQMSDNWSFDLGYALTHRKVDASGGLNFVSYVLPRNSYHLGLHFQDGAWKANLNGIMGTGSDASSNISLKRYVVFSANASYDIADRATIYLLFNNLNNRDYGYYGSLLHSPGRFFMAGVQCKF